MPTFPHPYPACFSDTQTSLKGTSAEFPLIIATRESRLALWQANWVKDKLTAQGWHVVLLGMTTRGDQVLDTALSKVGGKGLFVKELESALLDGRADIAVHSLKDLPMDLPGGLHLAVTLEREDPRDAWISSKYPDWKTMPSGTVIGTSSVRRQVLFSTLRPDVKFHLLRGNLDTRLRKLDEGQYDGIILAAAGLKRMQMAPRIQSYFEPEDMLPAPCQGIIGVETRTDDTHVNAMLTSLNDTTAWLEAHVERAISREVGGNCSIPLGAFAKLHGQSMRIRAALGNTHRQQPLRTAEIVAVAQDISTAQAMGKELAQLLLIPRSGTA